MERLFEAMDNNPAIPIGMFLALVIMAWLRRRGDKAIVHDSPAPNSHSPAPAICSGLLSQVLYWWSPRDPFTVRDLLRSVAVFGASGSGKTSGSGYQLAKNIVRNPKIGLLILASKPEDRQFWQRIFAQAGRQRDLLVFGPDSPLRFNFLDFVQRSGGDTRDITQAIMVIGETLEQSNTGQVRDPFWRQQNERMMYNAVEVVQRAMGKVTAPDLQRFINGAAQTLAALTTPEWQSGFHSRCLETAFGNLRTSVQKHDYALAADYWLKEMPVMADRTRSSILAGVMGILHVFNTGIVRELVSTGTNVSPEVIDHAKSVLINMPISSDGAAGAFVIGGWQYLTQWHVLKRHATDDSPICVIWSDENQKVVNSFCPAFLAECRSHRGCMVCLTQSIHSYYARLREGGEHEADSYLTNFYHKIFHALGDDKTAAYASSLIGKRLKTYVNTSMSPSRDTYDALFGQQQFSSNTRSSIDNILENREFMQNLRTGGEGNNCVVDGVVVRSGEPFSSGEAWMKVAFSQK